MRTVHAYAPSQQQQPQQPAAPSSSSSSTASTNQQHSSMSGYPSIRHSLLRMHSQLRSAPDRRESSQGPIDLSQYRLPRPTPKMTTRSTSTSTATTAPTLRSIPIVTSLATAPTRTIYSSAIPSSSSSSSASSPFRATSMINQEEKTTLHNFSSAAPVTICPLLADASPTCTASPKLAYAYTNIEENLQCPLCIDRLRDPRALPCQHVFCCSCLKSIPSSNLPYPTISCPLCRRTFPYNGADQFPVSYIHRQLLELVPKNYDINGKCNKCQEKTSLTVCSCCDYLLCEKCSTNDREKILDNIQHIVQTCHHRLNRIHTTRDQLNQLNETNRTKIHQIESILENFERKFLEHKHTLLSSLNNYNDQIQSDFWSKLNLSTRETTEPFITLLQQADALLKKSHTTQFDDILSLFYNLNSINEQLEQASTLIDTCDVQTLFKQNIRFSDGELDEHIRVHVHQKNTNEAIFQLIPSDILPRLSKRVRKTEPKRHVELIDDDDDDDDQDMDDNHPLHILKRMKIEYEQDMLSNPLPSPTSDSILFLSTFEGEQLPPPAEQDEDDSEIIYLETIQTKSPPTINFDDLFQIIDAAD